jgi:predicted ArsR family transcriptional regulator
VNGDASRPDRRATADARAVDDPGPAPPAGRRGDIVALLRDSPSPLGPAEIAQRLGVHPNTVRFHLGHLVRTGRVERVPVPPIGRGRPKLAFRMRRGMDPAGPRNYRLLAEVLADGLGTDPAAVERVTDAGRRWGQLLVDPTDAAPPLPADDAVDRLVGLLDDLGFAPEGPPAHGERDIGLRHCPFLEVVQTRGPFACQVHLALMQGALAALGAPVTVDRLEPFVEPDLCLAHLSTADRP